MISLPLILLAPIVVGIPLAVLTANVRNRHVAWAAVGGTVLVAFLMLLALGPRIIGGETFAWSLPWMPEMGIDIDLRLDALGFLFCFLILGIGLLIVTYARFYLSEDDPLGKFYVILMVFMTAMLGIALADNLIFLLIAWELTSLSSFFLIAYWSTEADSRRSARVALAVTGGGGLALIGGAVLLAHIGGSFQISELVANSAAIVADPRYPWALVLILLGAFTKSAQYPFHFWLPAAMAAPTPVSAYLHSATMVKAGLLLVAKLLPVIGGTDLFITLVAGTGLVTMVFAAATAMFKHDLKGLLAYSTVSHLGLIMFLLGLSTPMAIAAGIFHIINHAAFKAALFMSAGNIDHEAGTRDIRRLGGLWRFMPITMVLATIAAASMAGIPPFNGFISKEMFFEETLHIAGPQLLAVLAPGAVVLGGAFSVAYSLRYIHDTFFNGKPRDLPLKPHDPPLGLRGPVVLLVIICVAIGLAPALIAQPLVGAVAQAVLGPAQAMPAFKLSLWHGFNAALGMSMIAVVGGVFLYLGLLYGLKLHQVDDDYLSARRWFEGFIRGLIARAARATAAIDRGSLQRTLGIIVVFLVVAPMVVLLGARTDGLGYIFPGDAPLMPTDPLAWAVWAMAIAGAAAAVLWRRDHVALIVASAVVGLSLVLAFVRFSAPDLALTQLSVEVASTVLLFMGLALLPRKSAIHSRHEGRRMLHATIAGAAGLGVGWLAYLGMTRPATNISWYFMANSYVEGGGKNAVNVILVDFRGFDTLGEIAVLGIAALGVYALLTGIRMRKAPGQTLQRAAPDAFPLMLQVLAGWLLPLALMVAVYIFLRGHNLPGGGFIAGLIAAISLLSLYMAFGLRHTDARLPIPYDRMLGWGLLVAVLGGVGSFLFGFPFLTSHTTYRELPVLGEIPFASAMVFDLGVFLVVVSATLLTVVTLGRVSQSPQPDAPTRASTARGGGEPGAGALPAGGD